MNGRGIEIVQFIGIVGTLKLKSNRVERADLAAAVLASFLLGPAK